MKSKFDSVKLSWLALVLFAGSAVVSCAPFKAPVSANPTTTTERITMLDFGDVATSAAVKAKAEILPAGNLKVVVQLIREYFGSSFVEIKVKFVDGDGFELEETNWQPVQLHRDVVTQYQTVSLNNQAKDWRMIIRSGQE